MIRIFYVIDWRKKQSLRSNLMNQALSWYAAGSEALVSNIVILGLILLGHLLHDCSVKTTIYWIVFLQWLIWGGTVYFFFNLISDVIVNVLELQRRFPCEKTFPRPVRPVGQPGGFRRSSWGLQGQSLVLNLLDFINVNWVQHNSCTFTNFSSRAPLLRNKNCQISHPRNNVGPVFIYVKGKRKFKFFQIADISIPYW